MSTYSSNLRLELITTGTQAGTWGNTTNTNIGTLLEGAISGSVLVTVTSTAQALTANNGASDESRLAMLQLGTSGISSAFAVYAPPASKQYTIYNGSSYTATIYNSTVLGNTTAAGTGVAIPSGATVTVWSDGTSFYQQNTYLNAATLNTPTITGVSIAPTAAFGTSTTQLATTAFVQAALQALHPVGSIYTSTSSTNPGTSFGFGTWVAYGAGRVLIGNGGGYSAGATGGSADAIVVSHSHTASSSSSFTGTIGISDSGGVDHTHGIGFSSGTQSQNHTHAIYVNSGGSHTHTYKTYGLGNSGLQGNAYTNSDWGWATTGNPAGTSEGAHTHSAYSGIESTGHSHYISGTSNSASAYAHQHYYTPSGSVSTSTTVASSGSSGTGANLQPYVVVYMWNRTA